MLINNIYNLSEISDEVNINNIILDIKDSYEDKWKSINKINTSIEVPIRLSIDAKNIKLAEKLEEEFASIDLISDFRIDRFNNKEVIYKVIFNNTHDKFLDIMSLYNFKIDTSKETWRLD